MEQYAVMNRQKPRFHTPILVLAIVALALEVVGSIDSFVFEYSGGAFEFFPLHPLTLVSVLLYLSPYALLTVYASTFRGREKESVLAPVIFGLIALNRLLLIVFNAELYLEHNLITQLVRLAVVLIAYTLATVDILTNFAKKILPVVAAIVGLLTMVDSLVGLPEAIEYRASAGRYLTLVISVAGVAASVVFYTALLLVALRSRTMPAMATGSTKNAAPVITPEKALRILQEKKDMGLISEEEYRAERMDIISRI